MEVVFHFHFAFLLIYMVVYDIIWHSYIQHRELLAFRYMISRTGTPRTETKADVITTHESLENVIQTWYRP